MFYMEVWLKLIVCTGLIVCSNTCTFPSDLIGDWFSSRYGTLTFTTTSFSGFSGIHSSPLTFTCNMASGNVYVSKATYSPFTFVTIDAYLCMELTQVTTNKYVFTLNSNKDVGTGIRFYVVLSATVTMAEVCNVTDVQSPGEYELLVKTGQLSNAAIDFPFSLQSKFDVTMTTSDVTDCNSTSLDGRVSDLLTFNYSSCVTGTINTPTDSGILQCLYYKTSGLYTYVTMYNNDTTATYTFTCLALRKSGATVTATEYPNTCFANQTSTYVPSPGVTYAMTDLLYSTETESEGSNTDTILLAVLCSVAGIIIIVIITIVVYKKFCFIRPPPPPKIRKKKHIWSVTDYSLNRSLSAEKEDQVVRKKTTEEVITGIMEDKRDSSHSKGVGAYEPPKKEAWQKKWEMSPRKEKDGSLKFSKQEYTSAGKLSQGLELSVMELDQAFTMSTSLPESLDYPSGSTPKHSPQQKHKSLKESGKATSENIMSTRAIFANRAHASPRIPESTGKFGGSTSSMNVLPLPTPEQTLGTISENPLSREASTVCKSQSAPKSRTSKKLLEYPNLGFRSARDRMSNGTASVGDISLQNLSSCRSSHLSASMSTIFDDPSWLMENSKSESSDKKFDVIKNLEPGIPKPKEKDSKWFLFAPKVPELNREDLSYFNSKTKINVGLNSPFWGKNMNKSESLQIIERDKMRWKMKSQKPQLVRVTSPHFED